MVAYERDALARRKMTSDFRIVLAGVFIEYFMFTSSLQL